MPDDVSFIPVGSLGDAGDGTTADFARSRGRWQALPKDWLSAENMRAELMRLARVPDYDTAAGEALVWAMGDWLEVRGSERMREYRAVETPPEPLSPTKIFELEAARRAELEHERFEREMAAREARSAEIDQVVLDGNRRLHREHADEYCTPRIEALERRLTELEGQLAQRGELEAAGAIAPASETPAEASEPPAEPGPLERARRWMYGEPGEIERLLEQGEDGDE
jgi:hypothetical protein